MSRLLFDALSRLPAVALLLLAIVAGHSAAAPLAGSFIDNQATVRYVDSGTGLPSVMQSNTVRLVVQPLEAALLTQDQSVQRPAGATVSFSHRLVNSGNTPTAYTLTVVNLGGDDFDLATLRIVLDANGNGVADAGESQAAGVTLAAGAFADLVVTAQVPGSLPSGLSGRLQLNAVSQGQGAVAANTDTVVTVSGAVMVLTQSLSVTNAARNDEVTLRLVASNTGSGVATGVPLTIDGAAASRVVLRHPVPVNTRFVSAAVPSGAALLYHAAGAAPLVYTTTPPSDPTQVDEVAYVFENFAAASSSSFDLRVRVNANASGTIPDTAQALYSDGVTPGTVSAFSNTVQLAVAALPPTIRYYTNNSFDTEAGSTLIGSALYLQADASACNLDPKTAETVFVTLNSLMSGDTESFLAMETGPNTGVFRITSEVMTANAALQPPISGNSMVETHKNDALGAMIRGCGADESWASILIDPFGVVFDSRSNQPVAGATVQLIDVLGDGNGGNAGGPARVFQDDGVTPAPSTVVTGADGRYQFPLVAASTYRLLVTPPPSYRFASQLAPGLLPAGRVIDASGSYGGNFIVSVATGAVRIDVPVDADPSGGLLAQKTASRSVAGIGDFVDYTVQVKNASGMPLSGIALADTLPAGFAYQPGTARLNGAPAADPAGGRGPALTFSLDALADGATAKLSYRARIGPGAQLGDGVNRAQATSAAPLPRVSNVAAVKVRVEGGVFSDRGFILGKIYADCNGDRMQNAGEPGVPGVRVWLEDGTYAISDGEGKFSFHGLSPRTHVAKADPITLPAGARLAPLDRRHAGDGGSRFVDLKNGELARADFAVGNCDDGVRREIERRRVQAAHGQGEVEAAKPLSLDTPAPADPRALAASGIVAAHPGTPLTEAPRPAATPAAQPERPLTDLAGELDNTPDFIGLADHAVLAGRQTTLRVKGVQGAPLVLIVNGQPVAESRIGTRVTREDRQLELREYIGIDLQPGKNTLALEQRDAFGNPRASRTLSVMAPGDLRRIRLETREPNASADGASVATIRVRLEDANGIPVAARTPLTLEASRGVWLAEDLNKTEPGTQVFAEGGGAEFALRAPDQPGEARLVVSAGVLSAETKISFLPPLRELVASGLIEGVLNVRKLSLGALQPARSRDGFEQELKHFARGDDRRNAAARAALFLKGKIKGDYLLTLSYDSDKETRERLFRDIQPDQFYPVYGDASVKGYDAQSTGRLYVRVDKNKSWLLYGDFTSPAATPARNLAAYNRSLTGVREHYEANGVTLDAFASRDSTRQAVEELPANGTSGPYTLANANLIANSEKIEIVTRDRNQPGVVIKTVPQARFADYELEAFTGRILFRAPVPSLDADLNPNSIRITYEVDQGGASFWVAGVTAQVKLTDNVEVGAVAIEDRNPQDPARLRGANVTLKFGATTVVAEAAQSEKLSVGTGNAERIDIRHEAGDLQVRAYAGRTDANFDNPAASLSKGRSEAGAKLAYRLDERTRLVAEGLHTGDVATGARRDGVLLGVERGFAHNVKLEAGVRRSHETAARVQPASDTTSVRVKLGAPLPGVPEATVYGEAEQAVGDSGRKLLALGGEYRFSDKGRLYGRHEFISSLSGPYALDAGQRRNTTLFGIDSEYMKDGRAFSEYRARDAFTGREAEAAIGLRNQWQVAEGVRLHTGAERIQALAGAQQNESTALTGAVEYTRNPLWKGMARLELRTSQSADSVLSTLGLAWKIDREWTLLGRNILSITDNKSPGAGDRLQERLQFGMAYRDAATNVWNALGRYEYKQERDDTPGADYRRQAHIVSAHANVQPSQPLVITARYAGKLADENSNGIDSRSIAHLVSARATWEFARRWDAGVQASSLFSGDMRSRQSGLGAEVGYLLQDNMWVSVGYNVFGFKDKDLVGEDSTQRGVYLRLRFKFDEKIFERL